MTSETETALDLLGELVAIVRGECPSLLSEDSGGSAELSMRIDAALSRAPEAGREEVQARDVMKGLHRWLEWDFPTARQEYEAGAQHVLDAISPLPVEPYLPPEETFSAWRERVNQMRDDGSLPGKKTPRRLPPPSTGGEGEAWDRIPPAKRFGRRLDESAVKHLAPGTLLRFYSEDPWFDPSPSSPANGDIVIFTGAVSNTFPKVGPHLEVRTLGGRVYPGGGWVYQIFQFVADPSPEMGEISREALANVVLDLQDFINARDDTGHAFPSQYRSAAAQAVAVLSKLKENGLSREGLGGLARSQPRPACPADCADHPTQHSDGEG